MQYDNCFQLMLHIMMCWLQNILYICDCECVCAIFVCACMYMCMLYVSCVSCVCVVCVCVVCACIKVLELVMEVLKLFRLDAEDAR